jgi:predicted DNA-binding protein
MKQTTIRLPEEMIEALEQEARDRGMKRSEYMRQVLGSRSECDELRNRVDRLEREKRMILEHREENQELMRYVEDELSYRRAGVFTRMRWWLQGME